MKAFFLLVLSIIFLYSCQEKDTAITLDEKEMAMDLIQGAFDDLWAGVDSTKILDYHTEDFIILENGHIWDNDRIKEYMRKTLAQADRPSRINKMRYISIDKYGKSMQIAYHNHADFIQADTIAGTGNWLESAVAVKTTEGWKLKMMHSTWAGNE